MKLNESNSPKNNLISEIKDFFDLVEETDKGKFLLLISDHITEDEEKLFLDQNYEVVWPKNYEELYGEKLFIALKNAQFIANATVTNKGFKKTAVLIPAEFHKKAMLDNRCFSYGIDYRSLFIAGCRYGSILGEGLGQ